MWSCLMIGRTTFCYMPDEGNDCDSLALTAGARGFQMKGNDCLGTKYNKYNKDTFIIQIKSRL